MDLKQEWLSLTENYKSDEQLKLSVFIEIYRNYSDKSRFYHNTTHVKELLSIIELHSNKISNISAVKFAVWFHDVIYKAWRKDNEEKSAKLSEKSLQKLGVDNNTITKVSELILLTKGHRINSDNYDTNIFLDADLAILGCDLENYMLYSENIRKEYFFVPENLYKQGRISVLNKFLEMESIYKTEELKELLELKARKNLKLEIEKLKK